MPEMIRRNAVRKCRWMMALLCSMLLASCSTTVDDDQEGDNKAEENRFAFLRTDEKEPYRDTYENIEAEIVPDTTTNIGAPDEKQLAKLSRNDLGKKPVSKLPVVGDARFYDEFTNLNGDEEIPVSLIFNNAPLIDVLSAFADVLGFNFVADSDIKGVVTINLNSQMTRRELWTTFERMLQVAGATAKADGSLLRIMLRNKLPGQPELKVGTDGGSEIYYRALRTATAREVVQQMRSFLSSGGVCIELTKPNAVLVCDTKENMPKLQQLLEYIDDNGKSGWPRAVISCRNILPSKVAAELQEILPVLGFNVTRNSNDRNEPPGSIQLIGIDRLQVLVAAAATEEAINQIREWVNLLDSSDISDQERVFVYKVRHNKAAHLTYALAMIYDTQASSLSIDPDTGNKRLENINSPAARRSSAANTIPAANRNSRTTVANTGTNAQTDVYSSIFDNTVKIFADGVLNRLVIRTTPRTYASIKALLDKLDVVPAQVLLQVMIVEVTLSESTQFGLEFSGSGQTDNVATLFGTNYSGSSLNPFTTESIKDAAGNVITNTRPAVGSERQDGGTFLISDPNDPQRKFGYIRALAGNGMVKILSCPQILVSSNSTAKINVGKSVPLLKSQFSSTSSSGTSQQEYEYEETGVIFEVTPQVTSTDLIALELSQTLSQVLSNTVTALIPTPEISQRIVETSMTIANGQTMVIGGLIQESKEDSLQGLPFINKVPVINRLLGNTDATVERTEILVMITGYVINERSNVEEMIKRYNDAIEAMNDFDSKLGDRPDSDKHKPQLMTDKEFWL